MHLHDYILKNHSRPRVVADGEVEAKVEAEVEAKNNAENNAENMYVISS